MDGDLPSSELDSLLQDIKRKPELLEKMSRYQSVSATLNSDEPLLFDSQFTEKISLQLENEPHHFLPAKSKKTKIRLWPAASVAMAASLAIAVVLVQNQASETELNNPVQVQLAVKQQEKLVEKELSEEAQLAKHERFKAYLQAHSDDLYTHGSLQIQPFAQVAGYKQDR